MQLRNIAAMFQNQVNDSNLDVAVKDDFTVATGKAHDVLGHGDHALAKQIQIVPCLPEIAGVVAADMVNDFSSLSKARLIATTKQALESHIAMARLQMILGVLNIFVAEIATVLAFHVVQVVAGLEVVLGMISFSIALVTFLTVSGRRNVSNSKKGFIVPLASF